MRENDKSKNDRCGFYFHILNRICSGTTEIERWTRENDISGNDRSRFHCIVASRSCRMDLVGNTASQLVLSCMLLICCLATGVVHRAITQQGVCNLYMEHMFKRSDTFELNIMHFYGVHYKTYILELENLRFMMTFCNFICRHVSTWSAFSSAILIIVNLCQVHGLQRVSVDIRSLVWAHQDNKHMQAKL
jgi:hypothetical protein